MELEQHELSAVFPPMSDGDFSDLVRSVSEHGLLEPITIYEGKVLDGWHRTRACKRTRTPIRTKPFDGADPVAFVLAMNAHRRHLSKGQRAVAIVSARAWRKTRDGPGATNAEMAKEAQCSPDTIREAKAAVRRGLGEKILSGEISLFQHRTKRARFVRPRPKDDAAKDDEILKLRQECAEKDTKILELCDAIAAYTEAESDLAGHTTHLHNMRVQNHHLKNQIIALERRIAMYQERLGIDPEKEQPYGHIVHA